MSETTKGNTDTAAPRIPTDPVQHEALRLAATVIYFDDSSDYIGALWGIVNAISPDVAEMLEDGRGDEVYRLLNGDD